jgi:hypothetical protein
MQINTGLHSFGELVINYTAYHISSNTSEQHSHTNDYATTGMSMLPGSLLEQYMGIQDYGSCSAPTGSEMSPLNIHYRALQRDTQVGSQDETVGQHHGDRKDPYW